MPKTVAAFAVRLWDEHALALHPDDARALQLTDGELAAVHVPLGARAIHEARELLRARPSAPRGAGELHARLRRWVVVEQDCGTRGGDCGAATGVCAGEQMTSM